MKRQEKHPEKYNLSTQYYKNVPLNLILYTDEHFAYLKAKRFVINHTNQICWIPNVYLYDDGTIKENANIDFVFHKHKRQLELAGITFDARERRQAQ